MSKSMVTGGSENTQSADMREAFAFIPDRLYYVPLRNRPHKQKKVVFFSIDEELVYWNFFLDFGPLNLGQLYRFCQIVQELLDDPKFQGKKIYYYSSADPEKRANAACLMASFMILFMHKSPDEAYAPFKDIYPPFKPYHDATQFKCTYELTVLDCLKGLHRGVQQRCVDFRTFNVDEYEHFERVECGDLNWLVKDKFLAFAGPHDQRSAMSAEGYETLTPEFYIPYFKKMGVTLVIRLNRKCYDERRFTEAGIKHLDIVYPDGTCPKDHHLQQFLEACENNKGAIAVHCKAGLGRTGTCIGCYMMKHSGFTAAEAIGWIRLCRPGSVIGPQQQFMEYMEPLMRQEGRIFRKRAEEARSKRITATSKFTKAFDFETKYSPAGGATGPGTATTPSSVMDLQLAESKDAGPSQGDELRSLKAPHRGAPRYNAQHQHSYY